MLNTVCTLVGQDFAQVAAWLDNRGMEVDIIGAMVGKLDGGALVTINASGIPFARANQKLLCS
jgi:ribulose-5-phosphate 4-epimerase/fuculose-1-phosphate aldolase